MYDLFPFFSYINYIDCNHKWKKRKSQRDSPYLDCIKCKTWIKRCARCREYFVPTSSSTNYCSGTCNPTITATTTTTTTKSNQNDNQRKKSTNALNQPDIKCYNCSTILKNRRVYLAHCQYKHNLSLKKFQEMYPKFKIIDLPV